jgi:hypothetical protein
MTSSVLQTALDAETKEHATLQSAARAVCDALKHATLRGLCNENTRNSRMLLSFDFPYLCVPFDIWSDLSNLVFLRGVVASVAQAEPALCSSNPRGSHFAIFTPLGTSERKLHDRFSLCLLNLCLLFCTWMNFHEVSPKPELSLR